MRTQQDLCCISKSILKFRQVSTIRVDRLSPLAILSPSQVCNMEKLKTEERQDLPQKVVSTCRCVDEKSGLLQAQATHCNTTHQQPGIDRTWDKKRVQPAPDLRLIVLIAHIAYIVTSLHTSGKRHSQPPS